MKTETQTYMIDLIVPKGTGSLKDDIRRELQDFMYDEVKAEKFLVTEVRGERLK